VSAAVQVLKELEAAVLRVDDAIAASRYAAARVDRETEERDALAKAASLLAPDWREWQWVKEAGFAAKVPARVPEEET
jgi:hypothetical protein